METASHKAETAARTIRPKLLRHRERFLAFREIPEPTVPARTLGLEGEFDPQEPARVLEGLHLDRSVGPVTAFHGGYSEARRRLDTFLRDNLAGYPERGNDPVADATSHLAPYLHFGQIAATEVGRAAQHSAAPEKAREGFLEQLIVRRELSFNHTWFHPDYGRYACLPDWAQTTLSEHATDRRTPCFDAERLEAAATEDPYWDAAMLDLKTSGFMPNYMRMYWGKKFLEWMTDPETAFVTLLSLNNKYFLDGRDPSSFANVAWCFGLHDRGWPERPIFGKVRYMNANGLRRKFAIDDYVRRVQARANGEEP